MDALAAQLFSGETKWPAESIYRILAYLDVEFGVSDHFDSYLPLRIRLGGREDLQHPTEDRINAWESVLNLASSLNFPLPG